MDAGIVCECENGHCTGETSVIVVKNGFSSLLSAGQRIAFKISGIKNPRSKKRTDSFCFYTYSSASHLIDQKTAGITIEMNSVNTMVLSEIVPASLTNGETNQY